MLHAQGVAHQHGEGFPQGECVVALAHVSDSHVCDAESPARLEYLDMHGHPGAPYRAFLGDIGTYRPQEILTVPVAIAALRAVAQLGVGPASMRPFDAALFTGDLVDNAQTNELEWFASVVTGGTVRATSGDPHTSWWVGAPQVAWNDGVWHPQGHRSGRRDQWSERHGFPTIDGLLEAARSVFTSDGLNLARVFVHGNHDLLLQGTVAGDSDLDHLARGDRRVLDLPPASTPLAVLEATPRVGPARYPHSHDAPTEVVPPDHARQLLTPGQFGRRLTACGHISTSSLVRGPGEAFDMAINPWVRVISLDTVNPHGGWEGSLDLAQFQWLRTRLRDISEPYVVIASHHPSWCLMNGFHPATSEPRVLADDVLRVLLDEPRVICWLAGHVHQHSVVMHRRETRVLPEITTASLIDWPQQWRTLEVIREPGGTLALVSTAVDHAGVVDPALQGSDDPLHLAGLSRLIAHHVPDVRRLLQRNATRNGPAHECNIVIRVPDPQV